MCHEHFDDQIYGHEGKGDDKQGERLFGAQILETYVHETDKHNVIDGYEKQWSPCDTPGTIKLGLVVNDSNHRILIKFEED